MHWFVLMCWLCVHISIHVTSLCDTRLTVMRVNGRLTVVPVMMSQDMI